MMLTRLDARIEDAGLSPPEGLFINPSPQSEESPAVIIGQILKAATRVTRYLRQSANTANSVVTGLQPKMAKGGKTMALADSILI